MEVIVKDNKPSEIELGDVFYDSQQEKYYIFTVLGESKYGLISDTFDELYENESYSNIKSAILNVGTSVKNHYLIHYPSENYNITLNIEII